MAIRTGKIGIPLKNSKFDDCYEIWFYCPRCNHGFTTAKVLSNFKPFQTKCGSCPAIINVRYIDEEIICEEV